jgi:hypothetical protein
MKTKTLIEKINFMNFTTLERCKDILHLTPYYANYINEQKYGTFSVGSLIFQCEDGFVIDKGLIGPEYEFNETAVGYVTAMEHVMTP